MASLERLSEGQKLWTPARTGRGGDRRWYEVVVVRVDLERRRVLRRINNNPEGWSREADVRKWRVNRPPSPHRPGLLP